MNKKTKVIPIFIPHEGCPHDCIFCNQKKISGTIKAPNRNDTEKIINDSLNTIDKNKYNVILAFYGGSFTAIDAKKQIEYLQIANYYKDQNLIDGVRISTRPDYLLDKHVQLIKEYKVDHVELGIQSTNEDVLNDTKRFYSIKNIHLAVDNLKKHSIDYGFQIMVGLPGDNIYNLITTCFDLLKLKPKTIRIYPTLVIKDTQLQKMFNNKCYKPLTLNEAVEYSVIPYIIFDNSKCNILRVGLHPSESLLYENSVIAGPFHSAFGELVQSRIYWLMLKMTINNNNLSNKSLIICANQSNFSKISGNKQENRIKLNKIFSITYKFENNYLLKNDIIIKYESESYNVSKEYFYNKQIEYYKDFLNNS